MHRNFLRLTPGCFGFVGGREQTDQKELRISLVEHFIYLKDE